MPRAVRERVPASRRTSAGESALRQRAGIAAFAAWERVFAFPLDSFLLERPVEEGGTMQWNEASHVRVRAVGHAIVVEAMSARLAAA